MRGARLGETAGVREEYLRLKGTLIRGRALSMTTDESGGVEGEGGRLVERKMDGFLSV